MTKKQLPPAAHDPSTDWQNREAAPGTTEEIMAKMIRGGIFTVRRVDRGDRPPTEHKTLSTVLPHDAAGRPGGQGRGAKR